MTTPTLARIFTHLALLGGVTGLAAQEKIDFLRQIKPIFKAHCYECHTGDDVEGELHLGTRKGAMQREDADPVLVPGKPEESMLYQRITLPADDEDRMPSEHDPLAKEEITRIRQWIEQGAPWPEDDVGMAPEKKTPKKIAPVEILLPTLSPSEQAAAEKAIAAIHAAGNLAGKIARDSEAIDVNFSLRGQLVKDDQLAGLGPLRRRLLWLNLSRTGITDAGLEMVATLHELRRLNLSRTEISDAGLARLAGLKKLEYLNLYGTEITDAGLRALKGMKHLRKLFLWQTRVTDEGVARLRKALPGLHLNRGGYLAKPSPLAKPAPINSHCPFTGKPIDAAQIVEFGGKRIAFCCAKCKARYEKDPKKYAAKLEKLLAKASSATRAGKGGGRPPAVGAKPGTQPGAKTKR